MITEDTFLTDEEMEYLDDEIRLAIEEQESEEAYWTAQAELSGSMFSYEAGTFAE
jgi:hypothetical protein